MGDGIFDSLVPSCAGVSVYVGRQLRGWVGVYGVTCSTERTGSAGTESTGCSRAPTTSLSGEPWSPAETSGGSWKTFSGLSLTWTLNFSFLTWTSTFRGL